MTAVRCVSRWTPCGASVSEKRAMMTLGYVVTCVCGHRISVRVSMAGLAIACSRCGRRIAVPSLKSLRQASPPQKLPHRDIRTRRVFQYRLRHLFALTVVCALLSTLAHYLGVGVVFAGVLFVVVWGAGALFVTRTGRRAIHFFWDSIVGYKPRS